MNLCVILISIISQCFAGPPTKSVASNVVRSSDPSLRPDSRQPRFSNLTIFNNSNAENIVAANGESVAEDGLMYGWPGWPHPGIWPTMSDHDYEELLKEGCSLLGMMATRDSVAAHFIRSNPTPTTATSPWREKRSFADWGWVAPAQPLYHIMETELQEMLNPVMSSLGLPPIAFREVNGGTIEASVWQHNVETTHDGIIYKPTYADMAWLIDVHYGIFIAYRTFGPKNMGLVQDPPVTILPKFKNVFDLEYVDYKSRAEEASQPINRLKYMFVHDVQNPETGSVIKRLLGEELHSQTCYKYLWPMRITFYPGDEGYRALIATPNGRSPALMLATHKSDFGERRIIEKVDLWCVTKHGEVDLLFTVKDYDEEDDDSDWTDEGEPEDPGSATWTIPRRHAATAEAQ